MALSAALGSSAWATQPSTWDGRAPSFACSGSLSTIENMICADPKASKLDYSLESTYRQTRQWVSPMEWKSVTAEQRQWLAERDRCKAAACLIERMNERSDRLLAVQTQAADAVRVRLHDKRFVETVVEAGIEALRKKYGADMDDDQDGVPLIDSFDCSPSGYRRFTCTAALGMKGTCDDGSRSGDSASFDVAVPGAFGFRIGNVIGYEACTGAPFARHKTR